MASSGDKTAFIGGGNMAGALIGGLVGSGRDPASIVVVEPDAAQRARLAAAHGVHAVDGAAAAGAVQARRSWSGP